MLDLAATFYSMEIDQLEVKLWPIYDFGMVKMTDFSNMAAKYKSLDTEWS